jgi:DNA-binding MarR family transcriptional regulator
VVDEIRVDLLRVLDERPLSMRQLAERLGEQLSDLAPAVLELWKEGSIEPLDSNSDVPLADRRFRATVVIVDTAELEELSLDEQYEVTVRILEGLIGEAMAALRTGHLNARPDAHITWTPISVDEEGWREAMAILNRAFKEVQTVKLRCAERLRGTDRPATPVIISMLGFERGQ